MTPRTLFNILLKALGILVIRDIIALLPDLFSAGAYLWSGETSPALLNLFVVIPSLLAYCVLAYYLMLRSDWIMDKFNIDKGFEDDTIELNMHRSTVLSISIIVLGGLIVVDEAPRLTRILLNYLEGSRFPDQYQPSLANVFASVFKIIIGLVLLLAQRTIVNAIELQRKR